MLYQKRAENSDMVYKLIKEEVPLENLSRFLDDLVEYSSAYAIIASKMMTLISNILI